MHQSGQTPTHSKHEYYHLLFEHSPIGVFLYDHNGVIQESNSQFARLMGTARENIEQFDMLKRVTNEGVRSAVISSLAGEPGSYYGEYTSVTGNKTIFVRFNTFPLKDEDNKLNGGVGLIEDLTDREKYIRALAASEQNYRLLIDQAVDGILIGDPKGHILIANSRMCTMTGYTVDEILGRHISTFLSPESVNRRPLRFDLLNQGHTLVNERDLVRKDGSLLPIEMHSKKLPDGRYQAFFRDISERKHTEHLIQQSQKIESMGVLAGGIAHDFNNMLTAILGNLNLAQVIVNTSKLDPRLHDLLIKMEGTVLKASALTKKMLAYSGREKFTLLPCSLNHCVLEIKQLLECNFPKGVQLELLLAKNAPEILADRIQIQQVVMNLMTNAAEAMAGKSGTITIQTSHVCLDQIAAQQLHSAIPVIPGDYALLSISDTGCGMSNEVQTRIFDPFFTTKTTGRGLGLSATIGILRAHRAGLHVESSAKDGTTFKVYFPLASQGLAQTDRERSEHEHDQKLGGGKILIADDEPSIQAATGDMLRELGFEVVTANDGEEALRIFKQSTEPIRLVVLDLTMPGMDGYQAFEKIRELNPKQRILLSSGYSRQDNLQNLLDRGGAAFLQKPYQYNELRRILETLL